MAAPPGKSVIDILSRRPHSASQVLICVAVALIAALELKWMVHKPLENDVGERTTVEHVQR